MAHNYHGRLLAVRSTYVRIFDKFSETVRLFLLLPNKQMISPQHQNAAAWTLYMIYEVGLWPIGTFLSGFEGVSLLWPAIAAVPIYAITYSSDRRRQAHKEKPVTKTNSAVIAGIIILVAMLGLYYLGFAMDYFCS